LISFDPTTLQLAIGNATSLSVFNTAAGFLSQLTTTLNGSTAVFKLVAAGQYDAATNTFQPRASTSRWSSMRLVGVLERH